MLHFTLSFYWPQKRSSFKATSKVLDTTPSCDLCNLLPQDDTAFNILHSFRARMTNSWRINWLKNFNYRETTSTRSRAGSTNHWRWKSALGSTIICLIYSYALLQASTISHHSNYKAELALLLTWPRHSFKILGVDITRVAIAATPFWQSKWIIMELQGCSYCCSYCLAEPWHLWLADEINPSDSCLNTLLFMENVTEGHSTSSASFWVIWTRHQQWDWLVITSKTEHFYGKLILTQHFPSPPPFQT